VAATKPIIIDCDPGVDDALALILALNSARLEVRAITTVCGNVTVDQACSNASLVMDLVSPARRPVLARGAAHPLHREFVDATDVHGPDGLGDLDRFHNADGAPRYPRKEPVISDLPAWELTRSLVEERPGQVTLVAIGPLTNTAILAAKHPETLGLLKELVIMGGSYGAPGNVTPYAEFNFWVDPDAARAVLSAGIQPTCIGLDLTHTVELLSQDIESRIRPLGTRVSEFVCDSTEYTMAFHRQRLGLDGMHIHDALAAAYAAAPALFETKELSVRVECNDPERIGAVDLTTENEPNVRVAASVDRHGFFDLFFERLA
jgi:pyrimidine-specific ribonucleoside hydrolase